MSRSPLGLVAALLVGACSGGRPMAVGAVPGPGLAPCPGTPNCVHTRLGVPDGTRPIHLISSDDAVWTAVRAAVLSLPRTRIRREEPGYLHAESTSRVFRFVDDLEVLLDPSRSELVVRSASRVGRGDLGVNRRRVEQLRSRLDQSGVLRAPAPTPADSRP